MCKRSSRPNPLQTIVEVSELLQEFLKHASLDGFIESWCLEITLQSGANEIPEELSVDYMHHLIGLHSLNYLILKRLDEQNHDTLSECCSCGWEISHVPEFLHTDIDRYTPGTIIRWSQGECHVLLAPHSDGYKSQNPESIDHCSEPEEPQPLLEEGNEEVAQENQPKLPIAEEEHIQRSGVIQSTEFANALNEEQQEAEPVDNESQQNLAVDGRSKGFLQQEEIQIHVNENSLIEHSTKDSVPNSSTWSAHINNDASLEDSEDDEENSRMLVINEDDNSQDTKIYDKKEIDTSDPSDPSTSPVQAFTFHNVLPLTSDNIRAHSGDKKHCSSHASHHEEADDDKNNDDDSSSVSSSSSSSSSSTSTSSSSTSSDDDDRINFKKRVEQAAQAAREAEAAANTIPSVQEKNTEETSVISSNSVPIISEDNQMTSVPSASPMQLTPTSSFAVFRHPDDIQAAQGLAALGKGHEFQEEHFNVSNREEVLNASARPPFKSKTCKVAEKLLQNKNVDVRKLGPKNFQCGVCGKLFVRLAKALEHNITHSGEKPWDCDSCEKKFAKYCSLQWHKRAKHSTDQKYSCHICNKSFGVQSVLQLHLSTHTGLKPYACSVCGQRFTLKFTKETHEAQHTGDRPWCCNVCGKTFITKYKLRAHIRGHTGDYYCSICNSTFTSPDSFARHKKRHENSKTHEPRSIKTKLSNSKQTHKEIEADNKSTSKEVTINFESSSSSGFRCQMCNKMFQKSVDLTYHLSSCNAITYCPPSNIPEPPPSLLSECSTSQSLTLPPPESSIHGQSMTSCMLEGEKKIPQQFTSATVSSSIESLGRRPFLMQSIGQLVPYQHQESLIQSTSSSVPESLPDYLSEVAFGESSASTSTIIFQPAHGQG